MVDAGGKRGCRYVGLLGWAGLEVKVRAGIVLATFAFRHDDGERDPEDVLHGLGDQIGN